MTVQTTGDEVRSTFLVAPQAQKAYSEWENNKKLVERGVVSTMRDHVTHAIYECSLSTFEWIKKNHTHPLGDIRKSEIDRILQARNWFPPFAFVHIFHILMERLGRPPLWKEYDDFVRNTPEGIEKIGVEREELRGQIIKSEMKRLQKRFPNGKGLENKAEILAEASLNWRAGNAYYGFMRDMYTTVALRDRGFDLRVHPVADALFRTDAWVNNNILSIYVINPSYKTTGIRQGQKYQEGRKIFVEQMFPGNRFNFIALTMEAATQYGTFHFPSDAALDKVEKELRSPRA